jgi:hypothetical protein
MAEQRSDDLLRSRQEAALLLRLDPSNLSPSDALRCDLIATLRLSIDSAQADALEGRAADLGRLIVATESLVKLLPSEPPKPESQRDDPRVVLWNIIKEGRDRAALGFEGYDGKVRQVEALQAELASRDAEIERLKAGAPAPADVPTLVERVPAPAGNVVPISKPQPKHSAAAAAPAPRPAAAYDYDTNRSWRDHVLPSGEITATPMSKGRWWGPV